MNIESNTVGIIHLTASVIALLTGLFVLTSIKGHKRHKQLGYIYTIAMIIVNITAFMIYKLFGTFGIFHCFAILSLFTLFAGILPVLSKKSKNYLLTHFTFMYWSVVGLYCALFAELFTRLPILLNIPSSRGIFSALTGISIFLVMIIAFKFFSKYNPIWTKKYENNSIL